MAYELTVSTYFATSNHFSEVHWDCAFTLILWHDQYTVLEFWQVDVYFSWKRNKNVTLLTYLLTYLCQRTTAAQRDPETFETRVAYSTHIFRQFHITLN